VSAAETNGRVTHVRLDVLPNADLDLEDAGTVCLVNSALHDWNTVLGRRFQLDAEAWTPTEDGDELQFKTTVETTFETVLELYVETSEPLLPDKLVLKTVTLLSQQLPAQGIDYTSLFGSLKRVEHAPFARVGRIYLDNGEFLLEPESGYAYLPPSQVSIPVETLEPLLQAFEDRLAKQEMTLNRKRHNDLLELRHVYQAIAQERGITLATVNSKRGRYLPLAYVQGIPEPPESELEIAPTQSAAANLNLLTKPAPEPVPALLATVSAVQPTQVDLTEAGAYLNLKSAVTTLVESLKTYEDGPFSASKEGVTQQTAEEVAAYLLHMLLFSPSGAPGVALNGAVVQVAINSVVTYYEAQHDALVAQQEADAAAMYSDEPYPTEP
jgi:hypothetical protein